MLPQEMGCGFGMTYWRRVRAWQKAGVGRRLHRVLPDKLRGADKLDFSRVVVDSSPVCVVHGGGPGLNPTDRPNAGIKRHLLVDARGVPVNVILTRANCHEAT